MQWLTWVLFDSSSSAALIVFGALTAVYAFGLELNRRGLTPVEIGPEARVGVHPIAVSLLGLNALILAATGWNVLDGEPWLVALAVAHIAVGLAATRVTRISRELALVVLSIGIVLADIAFAAIASGLPLVLGWAVSALPFAAILGARSDKPNGMTKLVDGVIGRPDDEAARRADRILATAGLLGQIALAGFQSLAFDAPAEALCRPVRRHHGARRRRRARDRRLGLRADGRRPAAPVAGHAGAGLRRAVHRPRARGRRARRDARRPGARAGEPRPPHRRPLRRVGGGRLRRAQPGPHARARWPTPDALLVGLDQPLAAAGALAAVAGALLALSRAPLGIAGGAPLPARPAPRSPSCI